MPPMHHENSMVRKMLPKRQKEHLTSTDKPNYFIKQGVIIIIELRLLSKILQLSLKEITLSHYILSLPLAQTHCLQISSKCLVFEVYHSRFLTRTFQTVGLCRQQLLTTLRWLSPYILEKSILNISLQAHNTATLAEVHIDYITL